MNISPLTAISTVPNANTSFGTAQEVNAAKQFEALLLATLLKAVKFDIGASFREGGASGQMLDWVNQLAADEISARHIQLHGRLLLGEKNLNSEGGL